ncbi:MAG: sugar ABC transporter ATP-binding protein [Pseudomonadota bacterium]
MGISLSDIVMDFPGARALDHVSAEFRFDEVHGLIGENGAGKSTLVSVLAGSQTPTAGALALNGQPVRLQTTRGALARGIALVSQEGSLVHGLTGAQNILLGDEPRRVGFVRKAELDGRAQGLLAKWFPGVDIDLQCPVDMLDMADRKVVEIVRALRRDIRLLILDEPTATLQSREKKILWDIIRSLPKRNVGVVLISHFISEVRQLSDRITILRDGLHVGTYEAGTLSEADMVERMLKRGMSGGNELRAGSTTSDEPVLSVSDWTVGRVRVPRFEVRRGEVVGLVGLTGAGHFGFARSLYTGIAVTGGQIRFCGEVVNDHNPGAMQRLGIGFVPDQRMENALMGERTITENLSLVHPEAGRLGGFLSPPRERREATRVMGLLNVRATGPGQTIKTLSGGNKQKVSLGKWLYGAKDRYSVLIFIEPTEGVDVGAKREIYGHIRRFAESGVAVIIASSDLLEIEQITHRVVPFVAGRPGPEIPSKDYSEARFISAMAGAAA